MAWALTLGGASLRRESIAAFDIAIARGLAADANAQHDCPAGYGHLAPARARQVREAVREVIAPAVAALGQT